MSTIRMKTANCIITGAPATCWTGHLVALTNGPIDELFRMPRPSVSIWAGFANDELSEQAESNERGCFGEWRPEHGIAFDSY